MAAIRRSCWIAASALVVLATGGWSYGSDSNTGGAQSPEPTTIYAGKIEEATNNPCISVFNTTGASKAGYNDTYGYTFLWGPGNRRGNSAYSYGISEGTAAFDCWEGIYSSPYASYVGALTLLGDVEACAANGCYNGASGWYYANPSDHSANSIWQANVNIVSGFVTQANSLIYNGGTYSSPSFWNSLFNNWGWANRWFPMWFVGSCDGATTESPPPSHGPGSFYEGQMVSLHNTNLSGGCQILGQMAILWQYVSGSTDYDLTAIMNDYTCINKPSTGYVCGDILPTSY